MFELDYEGLIKRIRTIAEFISKDFIDIYSKKQHDEIFNQIGTENVKKYIHDGNQKLERRLKDISNENIWQNADQFFQILTEHHLVGTSGEIYAISDIPSYNGEGNLIPTGILNFATNFEDSFDDQIFWSNIMGFSMDGLWCGYLGFVFFIEEVTTKTKVYSDLETWLYGSESIEPIVKKGQTPKLGIMRMTRIGDVPGINGQYSDGVLMHRYLGFLLRERFAGYMSQYSAENAESNEQEVIKFTRKWIFDPEFIESIINILYMGSDLRLQQIMLGSQPS